MPDRKTAWLCLREALRDFRIQEWMPFGWLLALQLLFLICALNLQAAWGMAVAGLAALSMGGEKILHYPFFFIALPNLASFVEWIVYLVPGCVFIPLALLRVAAPGEGSGAAGDRQARLRGAILPTLIAGALNVLLLQGWQWVGSTQIAPRVGSYLPGVPGQIGVWFVLLLGAYLISVPFLYVPVRAVQKDATFLGSLLGGMLEGLQLLLPTLLIVVVASVLALPFLAPAQLFAQVIVGKMRPELLALLLAIYAAITSVANYLIYASVMRMHWARQS